MRLHLAVFAVAASLVACTKAANPSTTGQHSDTAVATSMAKPAANAEVAERTVDTAQNLGVPTAVADVGTHGEDLFDEAQAANWPKASAIMDSLNRSAAALTAEQRTQLSGVLDTLRKAVASHDRQTAVEAANRVTFLGAQFTEAYHPKMPPDIVRLDYYGRELAIWAARKDMANLASTSADLRRTWEAVKPTELSHGGVAAAARTDSLVAQLASAKTASEYAKLATQILDVVDRLEAPFAK